MKNKRVSCRMDEELKESVDIILNELSKEFYDEPRKNYRYAFEFLKDSYMNNPNFNDMLKEIQLTHQIEKISEEQEYLAYKRAKKEKELQEVRERIQNPPDAENKEITYISPKLQKAIELLKDNCTQREIEYYEDIPHEMVTAVSNSFKVKKTDLIRLAKQEFPNKEN